MLNLTLLGSGGGMPMPDRYLSSLLINYKGRKILIDCGEGTQVAMRKMNTGFKSLDIICITHMHGDHIFGIPGLLSTLGNSDRIEPVTIIGPEGIVPVIQGLLVSINYLPYEIHIIEAPKKPLAITVSSDCLKIKDKENLPNEEIILTTLELDHSSPCLGYGFYVNRKPKFYPEKAIANNIPKEFWGRLQNGEIISNDGILYTPEQVLGEERKGIKLSYITDTRPTDAILDFIEESDLFICEGTYGDNDDLDKAIINKHMTFKEAAILAKKGNVDELLLTHFGSAIEDPESFRDNAEDVFSNTIIGHDGYMKIISYN